MIKNSIYFIFLFLLGLNKTAGQNQELKLRYNEPSKVWTDALPVGNGRLGAMIYGKTEKEIIQFNEETLWTGQPHDYVNKGASSYFEKIRTYAENGNEKVYELAKDHFMSNPIGQQAYQPMGNIELNFPEHKNIVNYNRELDLNNAIAKVSYQSNGINYSREIFSSNPDQSIVIHLEADKPEALNFSILLSSPHAQNSIKVEKKLITLKGKATDYKVHENKIKNYPNNSEYPKSKIKFESILKVLSCDGEVISLANKLEIKKASKVTLVITAATSFVNYKDISGNPSFKNSDVLNQLSNKNYSSIKKQHIQDYQKLFHRLSLDLGRSNISDRSTDERIQSFTKDSDPSLVALLYQYGRYLLIASSRKGTQPANLQGIWNDKMSPPWDSKYTININTEMNYWLAEKTNLSECADPLIEMIKDLGQSGGIIAREYYQMNGWVTHHNTDIWRASAPIDGAGWGIWPTGGAWLSQHLWWHYEFTGDKKYLTNVYPLLKEASVFFSEYLTPYKNNPAWFISGPSNSPENGGLVMGPTMDHQIIRNLFSNTIEAASILGVDPDFVSELKNIYLKIAPNQIGKHGQLQEWLQDIDDPKNEHRHVSHLWGLHPGNEIHPLTTPDLAEACKVTLSHRGDEGTGWSRAWKINFWARLMDGDHAFLILKNLIIPVDFGNKAISKEGGGLYKNMFDAHPPFQIDGNFGATSGITEMILQTHLKNEKGDYILHILPALPGALPKGKIKGLSARGGFELEIEWLDGKLVSLKVLSKQGNHCSIMYGDLTTNLNTKSSEIISLNANLKIVEVP